MEALDSLWVPDDNSTLSPLPTGLQRYTGEQDFFLVVAHVTTSSITSSSVPYPWGAPGSTSYTQTVAQTPSSQMVNFLVPRGQFLSSVMGQAILNNSPLSTAGTLDAISNLPIPQLACYWQNNAVVPNGQTPPLCHAAGVTSASGTSPTNPYFVSVVADQENCANDPTTSVNCQAGGVPSEPALSTSSPGNAAPALQAVITLNLSSPTDLDRLLSGLLDNTTVMSNGKLGVNGHLEDVTSALPTLGLNGVVMKALVNASWASAGFYGAPPSYAPPPPPPPPSCSGLGCVWNAVSGAVVSFAAGVITAVATVVWDAVTAAAAYVDEVAKGLANAVAKGAQWVAATAVNTLKTVAKALEAALQALVNALIAAAKTLLNAIYSTITDTISAYVSGVVNSAITLMNGLSSISSSSSMIEVGQVIQTVFSFFFSVMGIQGMVRSLLGTLETVFSILQPVLSLFNPVTLTQDLLSAVGQSGAASVINQILGDFAGAAGAVVGTLFGGVISLMGDLGVSRTVSTTSPSGFTAPTEANGASLVNQYSTSAGDSGFADAEAPLTTQTDAALSIGNFVDLGLEIFLAVSWWAVLGEDLFSNFAMSIGESFADRFVAESISEIPFADLWFSVAGALINAVAIAIHVISPNAIVELFLSAFGLWLTAFGALGPYIFPGFFKGITTKDGPAPLKILQGIDGGWSLLSFGTLVCEDFHQPSPPC